MTPQTIIDKARFELNDTDPVAYRNSDPELLEYINDGLQEISIIAPSLFITTGDMECAIDQTEQGVGFSDARSFLDVLRVKNGRVVTPADAAALSAFNPDWGQVDAGPAVHWFKHSMDPLRFYIYPKAPESQVIEVRYVRNAQPVQSLTEEITEVPANLEPALVRYVISRAESKDDEHVNSGRASLQYQAFAALVKGPQ